MFKCLTLMSLMVFLAGCPDNPYQEPVLYDVSGEASVGVPIQGAKVRFFQWVNGKKGELLGEGETDNLGIYKIKILTRHQGPVLTELSGGLFINPVTKLEIKLSNEAILTAPMAGLGAENKININIWTTLATARAAGTNKSPESFKEAISKSLALMSEHFGFEITNSKSCDIFSEECRARPDDLLFTLSHLGLHQLAESRSVSPLQLILVLTEDISDGILDGKKGDQIIYWDKEKEASSNSFLLRKDLAWGIHHFVQKQTPEFFKTVLSGKRGRAGFYEKISLDKNTDIFSDKTPPEPFTVDHLNFNVKVDMSSSLYNPKQEKDDFGFSEYGLLDVWNVDKNPNFVNGYVVAHALLTNNENQQMETFFSEEYFHFKIRSERIWWEFDRKQIEHEPSSANRAEFCQTITTEGDDTVSVPLLPCSKAQQKVTPGHCADFAKFTNFIRPRFFNFSTKTGVTGNEIFTNQGVVLLEPGQSVLVKWYAKPTKILPEDFNIIGKDFMSSSVSGALKYLQIFLGFCGQKPGSYYSMIGVHDVPNPIDEYGTRPERLLVFDAHTLFSVELPALNIKIRLPEQPETTTFENVFKAKDPRFISRAVKNR